MDASRDIMESAKPPKPPRPGGSPEPIEGEREGEERLVDQLGC